MSVVSYSVEVVNSKEIYKDVTNTLNIYKSALDYVCDVANNHYDEYCEKEPLKRTMYIEHLIHNTKDNKAIYNFDNLYYKLPLYLLRDIESKAIGHISSYYSSLAKYNKERYENISNGKKYRKREPKLGKCNRLPTFYKKNTYKDGENDKEIYLKIYKDNTWKYELFKLKERDLKRIRKIEYLKQYNPELYIKGNKIFIKFIYEVSSISVCDINKKDKIICGIDLGVNTIATLSIMKEDGTVLVREFIKSSDIDHLHHLLNKKRKINSRSGKWARNLHISNKINFISTNIVNTSASKIVKICKYYNVDVIVFENLRYKFKRAKRSYRQKLHHWRKISIFNKTLDIAHRNGIRVSSVNPCGTSKYAYDGSGEVVRGKDGGFKTNALCRFSNGKIYNCDLSASMNIASRYIIREYLKHLSENEVLALEAKVPLELKGTKVTYNSLKLLYACIS